MYVNESVCLSAIQRTSHVQRTLRSNCTRSFDWFLCKTAIFL